MPCKSLFLWLIIQTAILPAVFSQTSEQLRANLYAFNPDGTAALYDGTLTLYDPDFSNAVDDYDAMKMSNFGENFGMLSGTKTLVIERRQSITASDTIFFKMWNMRPITYKLELVSTGLDKPGLTGVLEDLYLGTKTNLDLNGITNLTFTISSEAASTAPGRFRIIFSNPSLADPPLTFTGINAYQTNDNVQVEWTVENEKNIIQYDVEKSTGGSNFSKANSIVINVKNSSKTYNWLDINPAGGSHYYRIRSTSKTGSFKYSNTVLIKTDKTANGIRIYPNPVRGGGIISVDFKNMAAGLYHLRLVDHFGGTVLNKQVNHVPGVSIETLKPGYKLLPGMYHLEVSLPGKAASTVKVIVE